MTAITFLLITTSVLINACAQLLLKAGTNAIGHIEFTRAGVWAVAPRLLFEPHILAGIACYMVSLVIWIGALSRTPVSIAYPMLSIGYVVNAIAAWYLFAEPLTPMRVSGIAIIIVGLVMVTRS